MEQSKGIKELKELLIGLEVVATAGVKIMADKKINVSDLKYLIDMAKDSSKVVEAVDGLSEVSHELKDVDANEAIEIVGLLYAMADNLAKAKAEALA